MSFKNEIVIVNVTFDGGLLHIIVNEKIDIPQIIKYSKHSERHFIFYNCELIEELERHFYDSFFKKQKNYKYIIKYDMKFTSKYCNDTVSKYQSYIREQKLNQIL